MGERFRSECDIRVLDLPLKRKPFMLLSELVYKTDLLLPDYFRVVVPEEYRTDFASIPRFFWRLLPPTGRYMRAAVVHDWLCDVRPPMCDSRVAAEVFREAMVDLEVKPWKIAVMVRAVLWFGPKF